MEQRAAQARASDDVVRTEAGATVFGYPSTTVQVEVRRRPRAWRLTGAAQRMAIFLLVAPVAAVVPPHAPWLIGALVAGGVLARRRWTERYTLEAVAGPCPKCGAELSVKRGRLKTPHPVPCESCHHEVSVRVPEQALEPEVA